MSTIRVPGARTGSRADVAAFKEDLARFTQVTVPEAVRDRRDAVALAAHEGVVMMTLYDTGRARANWQLTLGQPAEGATTETDPSGAGTIAKGAAALAGSSDPYEPVWIHNGLPYIVAMERGLHNFRRIGAVRMVEATLARLRRAFGFR